MNSENKPKKAFEFDILNDGVSKTFKEDIKKLDYEGKKFSKKIIKHSNNLKNFINFLSPSLRSKWNAITKSKIGKLIEDLQRYRDSLNAVSQDLGDFVSIRGAMAKNLLFINDFVQLDLKTIQKRIKECLKELDDAKISDEEVLFIGEWIGDILLIQLDKITDQNKSDKYFQPTAKDTAIALQYSLLSYAYLSKRGLKLESNYNARNIRFISKLKTLYPGILMSRNGKGVDGIIVKKVNNSFLDINNTPIPDEKVIQSISNFKKYKENKSYNGFVANILSENVELKSLDIPFNINSLLNRIKFMLQYREPDSFKDISTLGMLCEYFNESKNNLLDLILVSDDENTLANFNNLIKWKLNFYDFLHKQNSKFNIYNIDLASFLSNSNVIKEEIDNESNIVYEENNGQDLKYAQRMLDKITKIQTTIYTELWEIYAFGLWNVKNINDEWYKENELFTKLPTSKALMFALCLYKIQDSVIFEHNIKLLDSIYVQNISSRLNNYFFMTRLISWSLDNTITQYSNKKFAMDDKLEILNKMQTFIKEYIDLTINPLTFKDLYEQKIKELNDLITELKPKTEETVENRKR